MTLQQWVELYAKGSNRTGTATDFCDWLGDTPLSVQECQIILRALWRTTTHYYRNQTSC